MTVAVDDRVVEALADLGGARSTGFVRHERRSLEVRQSKFDFESAADCSETARPTQEASLVRHSRFRQSEGTAILVEYLRP